MIIRNSEWGNKFVDNLSKDMRLKYPGAKGYSVRNLKYMKKFAQIFAEDDVDKYGLARITWSHHQVLMGKVSSKEEYVWYLGNRLRQQYHLEVGGKDFYIDLLFYNTKLRCYVAIDLKTGEFKPEQAGKMNFYLSALDDLVKSPDDNPSVGLILCRDENRIIAEYVLRDMSEPIGVSEYHLCTDLPLDLKSALPDPEEIRSRIDMKK